MTQDDTSAQQSPPAAPGPGNPRLNYEPARARDGGLGLPARRSDGLRRLARWVLLSVLALGLVAAGAYWHEPIHGWLGSGENAEHAGAGGGQEKQLWSCGMHPQVLREKPGICPICQMKLEPLDVVQSGQSAMVGGGGGKSGGERKVLYWWDPMVGASSISDEPGKSAMGMELEPVYEDEVSGGAAVTIDPVVVQNMGVRVARVTRGPVRRDVRAVGYLAEAQPKVRDVNLRVSGWVEKLHAHTEGQHVEKGDPLFDLYSPEVQVALQELVAARRSSEGLGNEADELARGTSKALRQAARQKLELWGLGAAEVRRLEKLDVAPRTVTFTSPITGHVTEKMVVEGAAVKAGDMVLRIVDHSTLWLDAQVFAQDLPFIEIGQKVTATVEGAAGGAVEGEVIFLHPHVDPTTRTATVRMELPNPDMLLRPGMYATAHVEAEVEADALLVPRESVIDTGTRQIVFVVDEHQPGHFQPRNVRLGPAAEDGAVQVLEGLARGETIVTSGQFLLDAESRMREAIQKHLNKTLLANASAGSHEDPSAEASNDVEAVDIPDPAGPGDVVGQLKWSADVDATFEAYLNLQKVLGAPQPADAKPLDVGSLVRAAQALADAADGDVAGLPQNVLDAASSMRDKPLGEQRALFKPLSDAMIALAESRPPSNAVADKLHVAFCPMAFEDEGGQWLQDAEPIANPYYATTMKRCGEVTRTLATAGAQ